MKRLFGNIPYIVDPKNITTLRKSSHEPKVMDAIFNYSDHELSPEERSILSKGLKYGIHERKVDTYEKLAKFEIIVQSFNKIEIKTKRRTKSIARFKTNIPSRTSELRLRIYRTVQTCQGQPDK